MQHQALAAWFSCRKPAVFSKDRRAGLRPFGPCADSLLPQRQHTVGMQTLEYTRKAGQRLTYRIHADEHGRFTVVLEGKELLRGRDSLSAEGRHRAPNKRKVAGAIAEAQRAIENLSLMDER